MIGRAPQSNEAYQAYEWLSHLYFYTGGYRRLLSAMEARWAAFPQKDANHKQQIELAGFRGLPDQVAERVQPSLVRYQENIIYLPAKVIGRMADYFFDTGGCVSSLSESEAKRLGLRYTESSGTIGSLTGSTTF